MASQLAKNDFCGIKHCWVVCEQNNIVISVRVDDKIAKWAIIASSEIDKLIESWQ